MRSDENFVRVYRAAHATEAHVIRGLLEQFKIKVQILGEHLSSGFGELPADVIEVEIRVPAFYEKLARQLIREYETHGKTELEQGPEWQCAQCGEKNPATFGLCWNCHAMLERD